MLEAKREEHWQHTSAVLAFVHNAGFGAKKAISPDEVNPVEIAKKNTKPENKLTADEGIDLLCKFTGAK